VRTGLSLVLVVMYGLRPFLVSGQKHAPSPLLGPQKVGGVVTIAASWTSLFLGCVVIHQNWVRAEYAAGTPRTQQLSSKAKYDTQPASEKLKKS
jgi:hypothetical protein